VTIFKIRGATLGSNNENINTSRDFCKFLFLSACADIPYISEKSTLQDTKNIEQNSQSVNSVLNENSSLPKSTDGEISEQVVNSISDMKKLESFNQSGWYYYFEDNTGKQFYYMEFNTSKQEMVWNIGYLESEYVNTFKGSFNINEDGVFIGDLFDNIRNVAIEIKFTIQKTAIDITDENKNEFIITIISSDLERYQDLENKPLTFVNSYNSPNSIDSLKFTIQQQIETRNVIIKFTASKDLTQKDNVLFDGANEKRFQFNVVENITEDKYFLTFRDEEIKYVKDETLSGKTILGYSYNYSVYYKEVEIRQGQSVRYYKIFIKINDTIAVIIDANFYLFRDSSDYYEHNILPLIQSVDVE
jgi:hypothetical protein